MSLVQEGLEAPIDNFVFRQCPAEFKLKATNSDNEILSWTEAINSLPHKSSLIQICHKRGIIFFPYHIKGKILNITLLFDDFLGALGFAPINNLAVADKLSAEFLSFSDDDSIISSLCLDPSEDFLYVAKGSKIIYAVDLTAEDKKPFCEIKQKLEDVAIECVVSEDHEIFALLQNGNLLNLTRINEKSNCLSQIDLFISEIVNGPISCASQVRNDLMAVGSKEKPEIYLINLESVDVTYKTISVPFEDLGCGSIGISSVFLFKDENNLLFSCFPENSETDDVPLLLLENISNEAKMKFSFFFDPCASRPPCQNQFYYQDLPISKLADNLVDLVVVGNYASPDLGICGRLEVGGDFQTFFIDDDEGLAQLPFIKGEVTYPLGLALDLSSKTFLDNLKDPEAKKHPPAPIIWVLTNMGHLCPFSMVKTDETEPFSFMKQVPDIKFPTSLKSFEDDSSDELKSVSTSEPDESDEEPQTPPQKTTIAADVSDSTPQTPSKVPLQQLASLQKSAEIKPAGSNSGLFSFKPLPVVSEPSKPIVPPATTAKSACASVTSQAIAKSKDATQPIAESIETVLVKKEEKMETMNVSSYQNILLAEVAATHAAMQEDIFSLKQLSLKNSLLLRQNSQKYFNFLESLESYAASLEKLVASSDKVFLGIKDRLDEVTIDFKELSGNMIQVKSAWNRIKQDNKINWDSRVRDLSAASQDLFERIDRLRNFMSNPIEASKYRATLISFVRSAQEKVQLLMAHLSNLFVNQDDNFSAVLADFDGLNLSPSLSSEGLLDKLGFMSLETSRDNLIDLREKVEKRNKSLLKAVKVRGSRLLIPKKFTPSPTFAFDDKHLKLTAKDESLISSFISAIKLTEEVPEFAETAILAKLSLEDKELGASPAVKPSVSPVVASGPAVFEFKPVAESKPFEFKPTAESKALEFTKSKPFEFKLPKTASAEPKIMESGTSGIFSFSSITSDKPQSASPAASFSFNPLQSKDTIASSPSVSTISAKAKSETSTFSVKSDASSVSSKSNTSKSSLEFLKETPKIPSIFTTASQPAAIEQESGLTKEISMPTLDSLNFGSEVKEEKSEAVKSFPSIFGVKTAVKDEDKPESTLKETVTKSDSVKSESTTFNFSSPSISAVSEKKDEPITPVQGYSKESTPEASPALATAPVASAQPAFSFSFAPKVEKSPIQPASSGFSITNKPTFGAPAPSAPVFGSTSIPAPLASVFGSTSIPTAASAPVFGSTSIPTAPSAPIFGSSSLPTASFSSVPQPAFGQPAAGSSGFAAFAAASNQGSTGFSAFAATQSNNGTGLTFASFLSADKDKKKDQQQGNGGAPSSFSFSGFRE
jgi:hypothetical protein